MRTTLCGVALAMVATFTLAGCGTGVDPETRAALKATLASVQGLTDLWEERLNDLDGDGGPPTAPPADDPPPTAPETVTTTGSLTLIGSNRKTGTETSDLNTGGNFQPIGYFPGERDTWSYSSWGVRGTAGGAPLFTATISGARVAGGPNTATFDPYSTSVTGLREFDNPTGAGTAAWTGKVRGYETSAKTFGTPVEGDAEVTMDLDSYFDLVDVDFTNFTRGHRNMSWSNVDVRSGRFSKHVFGGGTIEGRFYGDDHKGVAGTFESVSLKGVFGAVRQ